MSFCVIPVIPVIPLSVRVVPLSSRHRDRISRKQSRNKKIRCIQTIKPYKFWIFPVSDYVVIAPWSHIKCLKKLFFRLFCPPPECASKYYEKIRSEWDEHFFDKILTHFGMALLGCA